MLKKKKSINARALADVFCTILFTCCLSSLLLLLLVNGEANATETTSAADRSKHEKRAMTTTDVRWMCAMVDDGGECGVLVDDVLGFYRCSLVNGHPRVGTRSSRIAPFNRIFDRYRTPPLNINHRQYL